MLKRFLLVTFFICSFLAGKSQYISQCEAAPYPCPTVCAGGTLVLRIFQIQNLPVGSELQVLLSDANSSFLTGTQLLPVEAYSFDNAGVWNQGPFIFNANVANLMVVVNIPTTTPGGTGYTVRLQSNSGYVSTESFACGGGNDFTVNSYNPPLAPVAQNTQGVSQWVAHAYNWTPTVPGVLNIAQVNVQDFFNPSNYLGHLLYNNLSFDINYFFNGYVPGTINNGTSIDCGNTIYQNFSIRMLRKENFTPGLYRFLIAGDDGVRVSIDGGATWLVSSWAEQGYGPSLKTTDNEYPNGVCISGETDLVFEYFQRPQETRMTLEITQLSGFNSYTQPVDRLICSGENATFSISGGPAATSVQWQVSTDGGTTFTNLSNTGVYSGAFTQNLQITNVPSNFDGYVFRCLLSGPCGSQVASSEAVLSVTAAPVVTLQPIDQSLCAGNTIQFTAQATGTALTFQWQVSSNGGLTFTNLTELAPYSGTNTLNLTITNPPASLVGNLYRLLVLGCNNTQMTSTEVEILPITAVSITNQPINVIACIGDSAIFSVNATGAVNYQWQVNTGSGFVNISNINGTTGAQTAQLIIQPVTSSLDATTYHCIVTGGCGETATSLAASISVLPLLSIIDHPTDTAICQGDNVTFTINVSSSSSVGYQWKCSVDGGGSYLSIVNGGIYAGANSSVLQLTNVPASANGNIFRCFVNNICTNELQSFSAILNVNALPMLTLQPQNQEVCEGADVQFTTSTSGLTLGIQWQYSTDNGVTFQNVPNAAPFSNSTALNLALSNPPATMNGYIFQVQIDGCGANDLESNSATLTFSAPLAFIEQPTSITVCEGEAVVFTSIATGASTYQWFISNNQGSSFNELPNGAGVSGVTSPQLTINPVSLNIDNAFLQLNISGCGSSLPSNPIEIEVLPKPSIVALYNPESVCPNEDSEMGVSALYATTYQWQIYNNGNWQDVVNNSIFTGATDSLLLLSNIPSTLNNSKFRCIVTGECAPSEISEEFNLVLKGFPELISQPIAPSVCSGGVINLPVVAAGVDVTYNWQLLNENGVFENIQQEPNYTGINSSTLTVQGVNEVNGVVVRCVMIGCNKTVFTDSIPISVLQNDPVFIPNSFTPDGDYINPEFKIYTEGTPKLDATIYNRWGELMFQWTDKNEGWSGTYKGNNVPDGVYIYRIKIATECEERTEMGTITLYR